MNPATGREFQWGGDRFARTPLRRRVLVIGGGPAGLEAARVSAERGHTVTLHERAPVLGGQWRLAAAQPSRQQVGDHLRWYEGELSRLGVSVHVSSSLTAAVVAEAIRQDESDDVVLATGAAPSNSGFQRALPTADRLPGFAESPNAVSIEAVLGGDVEPFGTVTVVDDVGDWRGIGTAVLLAERGCAVTILTSAPLVAAALQHSAADIPLRQRFARAGGDVVVSSVAMSWSPGCLRVRSLLIGTEASISADWIVVAETARSRTRLAHELTALGVSFHSIGDCVSPRRASLAIFEGRRLALAL